MCKEEIKNGKTKVINKGVDVTLIAGNATADHAMKASRVLVVKGISTEVVEVLTSEPPDEEMLLGYAEKTGAVVFTEDWLYEAAVEFINKHESVIIDVVEEPSPHKIIETTQTIIRRKLSK